MEGRGRAHGGNSDSLIIEEDVALGLNSDAIWRIASDGVADDEVAHLMIGDIYSLKGCNIQGVPVDIPGKLHIDVEDATHCIWEGKLNIHVNAGCCAEEALLGRIECDVAGGAIREAGLIVEVETYWAGLAGIGETGAGCACGMAQSANIGSCPSVVIVVVAIGAILIACNIEQKSLICSWKGTNSADVPGCAIGALISAGGTVLGTSDGLEVESTETGQVAGVAVPSETGIAGVAGIVGSFAGGAVGVAEVAGVESVVLEVACWAGVYAL